MGVVLGGVGYTEIVIYVIAFIAILLVLDICDKRLKEAIKRVCLAFAIQFIMMMTMFKFPQGKPYIDEGIMNKLAYCIRKGNYIPGKSIVESFDLDFMHVFFVQIGGNIALFIPLGLALSLYYNQMTMKKQMASIFVSTLLVEIFQIIVTVTNKRFGRVFDIDDIICNFLGGLIGVLLGIIIIKLYHKLISKIAVNVAN